MVLSRIVLCLLASALLSNVSAQERQPQFRRHVINSDSAFSACTVFDVNHDGRLDIFCGGFWYEAPQWQRHVVRDVQNIRGRFDDYSNLPLDVNQDGWMDVVSINYRSQSLYWVEHPGAGLGIWKKHVIATPGASETGRLADVDGDGDLDVLPNGVKFAAWWELRPKAKSPWQRHELPEELAAHGLGFGDIDGDGRGDLVCPKGWAAAPLDRHRGRWTFHDEFRFHRDGSIPLLVKDVDGDGDADIIWGRGHNIGLYWLEQQSSSGGRSWQQHAIDTSWSQAHALLWGDVDGDGRDDLIAGKRYRGHDGKDPGENDPLAVYWYRFDGQQRTWVRGLISYGSRAGFDLDPEAIDLDADGDLDVVGAAQSGLFWFENRLKQGEFNTSRPASQAGDVPGPRDLLSVKGSDGKQTEIADREQWCERRADILQRMQHVLGPLPSSRLRIPLDMRVESEEQFEHYTRKSISYASDPGDRVPACLLIPKQLKRPAAALLCLHPANERGKETPSTWAEGEELARRGYVCLIPDYPSFGWYEYDFTANRHRFASGAMKAVWNNIRAIDLLETLPEVHTDKIGCIGHDLGGHNALLTASFDQRLRVVVSSCGFTLFNKLGDGSRANWTHDRMLPRLHDAFGNDQKRPPFDYHEVLAALAPRPLFVSAPLHDHLLDPSGVRQAVDSAQAVYTLCGKPQNLHAEYPRTRHEFPKETRNAAYDWLDKQLGQ